jgi:hypothetical protein
MALTDSQMADVRRFAGYPALGTDTPADDSRDFAYGWVSPGIWQTLQHRLTHLTPENEQTLINVYVSRCTQLETAILQASDNLDTDKAAVWTRNRDEVRDRDKLFDSWRRRMCGFLGIAPGPALGRGGLQIVRG